ncbi:hypothetical protein Taro_011155, partial [Colocasia esculenta]|nr:hypothetical protein [Colocasia esculenta]
VRLPDHVGRPDDGVCLPDYAGCPGDRSASPTTLVVPATEVESHHLAAEEVAQLAGRQPCWISGGKIDPGPASCYITSLLHAHVPEPVGSWKEFPPSVRELLFGMFTEARDKAAKTTGSQDPTAWMDYGPVWMRRDHWECLYHRWATGPWQERSQAAKRNRAAHSKKNVHTSGSVSYATHSQKLRHELEHAPTFRELFDRTHKRKGTNDYVSERARTIAETYDRTMADRYAEGTPQPYLDLEAWVDAVGGPRKGRVYGFGDSLDTTPVLSSYASSVSSGLCEFICCDAQQWWRGQENPHPERATAALWCHG